MNFPKLFDLSTKLFRVHRAPPVVSEKSTAVSQVLAQNITIENPQMADFEALEPGDILLSRRPGSQREVLSHNKTEKEITVKITRNTLVSRLPLPRMYRENETISMSPEDLVALPANSVVYLRIAPGRYTPVTLHSAVLGEGKVDGVQVVHGEFYQEETVSYANPSFPKIATKLIKRTKQ